MTPFRCFEMFLAMRSHFSTERYSYVASEGRCGWVNREMFSKRPDKYFFQAAAQRFDCFEYILGNSIVYPAIKHISKFTEDNRRDLVIYTQNMTEGLLKDLKHIPNSPKQALDGESPLLVDLWQQGVVRLETLVLIDLVTNVFDLWERNLPNTKSNKQSILLMKKYKLFFSSVDIDKYRRLIEQHFKPVKT